MSTKAVTPRFNPQPAVRMSKNFFTCIYGKQGTGKTLTALRVAVRLQGKGNILVIDGDRGRALDYAPSTPGGNDGIPFIHAIVDTYSVAAMIDMVDWAIVNDVTVIVVDGFTRWWSGQGGLQERHADIARERGQNTYTAWNPVNRLEDKLYDKLNYYAHHHGHIVCLLEEKPEYDQDMAVVGEIPDFRKTLPYRFDFVFQTQTRSVGSNKDADPQESHWIKVRKSTATHVAVDGNDITMRPILPTGAIIKNPDAGFVDLVLDHIQAGAKRQDLQPEVDAFLQNLQGATQQELRNAWMDVTGKAWPHFMKEEAKAQIVALGETAQAHTIDGEATSVVVDGETAPDLGRDFESVVAQLDKDTSKERVEVVIAAAATPDQWKQVLERAKEVEMAQAWWDALEVRKKEIQAAMTPPTQAGSELSTT